MDKCSIFIEICILFRRLLLNYDILIPKSLSSVSLLPQRAQSSRAVFVYNHQFFEICLRPAADILLLPAQITMPDPDKSGPGIPARRHRRTRAVPVMRQNGAAIS